MAKFPRGIDPALLVSQVRNTMPYLFDPKTVETSLGSFPPTQVLRASEGVGPVPLTHFEYFRLCVSSHYLTCGTPVPTDVDNQIRQKLWPQGLPLDVALEMAAFVLQSRKWDFTQVTSRFIHGARSTDWAEEALSGHLGEWFTLSSGAYCALARHYAKDARARERRDELYTAIADETNRHSEIFGSLWRAKNGLGCLKASSSIAHNFGDLDRVMDMWELPVTDPLRIGFYKLGAQAFDADRKLRYLGRLWVAGELYKSPIGGSSMALENHRHYALRKPRSLRRSPAFLVPTGPFFDDWGRQVARGLATSEGKPSEETLEVLEILRNGWERQPRTLGYGRGLKGMLEIHPELAGQPWTQDPARVQLLKTTEERFAKNWADEALKLMDEIPARAT